MGYAHAYIATHSHYTPLLRPVWKGLKIRNLMGMSCCAIYKLMGAKRNKVKPSDEHGDETKNIVSLQTVINVYHKYDKSLQIKQYQIIQCMYMRPMGWGPGYTPPT